jgi:ACGX-repeat protein
MNKINVLNGWAGNVEYYSPRSAQGYLNSNKKMIASSGVGSGCGSTEEKPKPSACGSGDDKTPKPSACGAGDDNPPKPSACGAGDDSQPKPSACGSSCGSDEK